MHASHHQIALFFKRLIYGRRGEPYRLAGYTLRYVPGTRPVRMRYLSSNNSNVRYDALQVQLFSTQLNEGDTAIDVGAHCGQYSIMMAALCGRSGHVVAFEPDPHARKKLLENLMLNPGVKPPVVESYAVSDHSGEASLFSRGGDSRSSLAQACGEFGDVEGPEEISVAVTSLDAYLLEKNLQPRWVKIDTEGAEIRILKGAKRLLSGNAGIVCELHPYAWPEFGNSLSELKDLVGESGRRIRYLDRDEEIGDRAQYGTVLLERLR